MVTPSTNDPDESHSEGDFMIDPVSDPLCTIVANLQDVPRVMKLLRSTLRRDFEQNWDRFCRSANELVHLALREGGITAAVALSSLSNFGDERDHFRAKDVEEYFDILEEVGDSAKVAGHLLCMGFDVRGTGLHGWNAFCYAVWRRKISCIPYITMAGADPNFRVNCDEYETPIEMAVTKDDSEMILALVAAGASLQLQHPHTLITPLELAKAMGHLECASAIERCIEASLG